MTQTDPVLERLRTAVAELFGVRVDRVMLFGSRARGDAKPDSDYDIALFLKDMTSRWQDGLKLADVELAILDESDASVNTLLFPAGAWRDSSSPLMSEIRNRGVDL